MSVLISEAKMPRDCCECFALKSNGRGNVFCGVKHITFGKEDADWLSRTKPNWCPLVEVPTPQEKTAEVEI